MLSLLVLQEAIKTPQTTYIVHLFASGNKAQVSSDVLNHTQERNFERVEQLDRCNQKKKKKYSGSSTTLLSSTSGSETTTQCPITATYSSFSL